MRTTISSAPFSGALEVWMLPLMVLLVAGVFIAGPTAAQITVRGQLAHDIGIRPGETVSGSIVVDNDTDVPREARIYQSDYFFDAEGSNTYGAPGTSPRSNARWITWSPSILTVAPRTSATISYSMTAPASDTLTGSYWSIIMVEGVDPSSADSSGNGAKSPEMGFRQTTRYGVQVAAHIEEGARRNVAFEGVRLVAGDGDETWFISDIVNTGTMMMEPQVSMRVFSPDGTEYGPFEGQQYRMYPGTSVRQRIDLSSLDPGTYQALLVVDGGENAVFGGQYDLTL